MQPRELSDSELKAAALIHLAPEVAEEYVAWMDSTDFSAEATAGMAVSPYRAKTAFLLSAWLPPSKPS
jgi:hypothetical protein